MRIIGIQEGGPLLRLVFRKVKRDYGRVPDPLKVSARHPDVLRAYGAFEWSLDRARLVDSRLKDLAGLKAATVSGCEYCIDIGSWIAQRRGVSAEQVEDLIRHEQSDRFSEVEKVVLDYAEAMSQTPCQVADELFERLRQHFDDPQLVELTAAIAFENYRARFNWALEIEPQGFSRAAACALPQRSGGANPAARASEACVLGAAGWRPGALARPRTPGSSDRCADVEHETGGETCRRS